MEKVSATSLIARDDTMLGICQGIGEDFGFNPSWLRLALGATLFWHPLFGIAAYAALGVLVLVSRLVFPSPKAVQACAPAEAPAPAAPAPAPAAAGPVECDRISAQLLPLAA